MSMELSNVIMTTGLSAFTHEPFLGVRAEAVDGSFMSGQLTVGEVRMMALNWLAAAEAAESDAIVFAVCVEDVGLEKDAALGMIFQMRERRGLTTGDEP
jgi:hypothetical protein